MRFAKVGQYILTGFFFLLTCAAWWGFLVMVVTRNPVGTLGMVVLVIGGSIMTVIAVGEAK